ncbi:hypothetical protein Hypma_000059 [Hypsizygus marmoreus]|uniref:Uncharacterized protein n=1 Tax=Hypsizygus marmoreus TaxID=39966 RepID=A0A369KAZ0_HYPMA|nr:hypothetical protein Hypma_000059 [Hypsizygus marmoreus]
MRPSVSLVRDPWIQLIVRRVRSRKRTESGPTSKESITPLDCNPDPSTEPHPACDGPSVDEMTERECFSLADDRIRCYEHRPLRYRQQ